MTRLLNAALMRHSLLIAAADHGFVDGGQHARPRTLRESPYDTRLFLLQSSAAARRWPISDAVVEELLRAFASCTPSAEERAAAPSAERLHRNGTKKRPRRKMKRAGKKTRAWKEKQAGEREAR